MTYHSVYRMFDGKAFFAPLKNPQRILDVGTGTGIWAIDVGEEYPSAQGKIQSCSQYALLTHISQWWVLISVLYNPHGECLSSP